MSRCLTRMVEALRPLGLYRLENGSLVDRELAAYEAAFAVAEELLAEIRRQAFVQTAEGEALSRHEKLVGLAPRPELDDETRRTLVLYRLGVAPLDFTLEGMRGSIRAAGMEAELDEDFSGEALTVRCAEMIDPSLDLDRLKAGVQTVLPAHLLTEFDIGNLTWDMLEATGVEWDGWDREDMTWNEFDINGHKLFGNS